jgi:hypothetical protein
MGRRGRGAKAEVCKTSLPKPRSESCRREEEAEGPWAMLGEPARAMSGALTFMTTHFTQFALFGEAKYHAYLPLVVR